MKRFIILILALVVLSACSQIEDDDLSLEIVIECDAQRPCPVGECYVFPNDSNAICYEGDPCKTCESGNCVIAESYPMQVFCE